MTWTDLASSLPVDHPPSPVDIFSVTHQHTSRPGTPIVTPRSRANFAVHKTSVSRPVSCLTNLGTPPEESEEEEEEEEEEETYKEKTKQKENRHERRPIKEEQETVENVASAISGLTIGSDTGSRWERHPGIKTAPSTPPAGGKRHSQELGVSVTCVRRVLTAKSRACSATGTSYRARHSNHTSSTEISMVDAKVIYATSHDPIFPPQAVADGRMDTFWVSSGLYPQFLVMTLPGMTSIENINIVAYNVRKVSIARSIKTQPTDFEEIKEEELSHIDGKLQESLLVSQQLNAIHLRITITEGHNHFCSVHKITITGSVSPVPGVGAPVPPPPPVAAPQIAPKTPVPPTPVRASTAAMADTMSITSSMQSVRSPINRPTAIASPAYSPLQSPVQIQKEPTALAVIEGDEEGLEEEDVVEEKERERERKEEANIELEEEEEEEDMVSVFSNSNLRRLKDKDDEESEDEF